MLRLLKRFQVLWQDRTATGAEIEPSERRFRTVVLAVLAIVGPPLVFALYHFQMFKGLYHPESMDYAQIARNVSSGRGFVTNVLRPLGLNHGNNPLQQPEGMHGPLFPILLAITFAAAGPKELLVPIMSGLFYLLTIPVLYRLAVKVFNRAVGLVTALIFTFSALILEYADSGLDNTLYVFLTTLLLLMMYNIAVKAREYEAAEHGRVPSGQLVLAGILLALLYSTDFIFLWVYPMITFAVIWLSPNKRLQSTLKFLVPLILLTLPVMLHNLKAGGNLFFGLRMREIWMWTRDIYPDYVAYRLLPGELVSSQAVFKAVVLKILLGVGRIIQDFPQVTASWVLAFFLPSLLFRFTDPAANALRRVLMMCFLGILMGTLLFAVEPNMPVFVSTIPVMLAFSVAYLLHLIRQAQMRFTSSMITTLLLGIAILFPLFYALVLEKAPNEMKREKAAAAYYNSLTKKGEVCYTDNPQLVAWYANRPAIWIPANEVRITDLRKRFMNSRWLFMTENVRAYGPEWQEVYQFCANWNSKYAAARESDQLGGIPPLVFQSNGEVTDPFLLALDGFRGVPPVKGGVTVVICNSDGPSQKALKPEERSAVR